MKIPGLGLHGLSLKELAKRVWQQMQEDKATALAAQLAYYFIFALFPALILTTQLISLLPYDNLMGTVYGALGRVAPAETIKLIRDIIDNVREGQSGGLIAFGTLATIWAASNGLQAVVDALNTAYAVKDTRGFFKSRLVAIGLTFALALMILISLVLVLFGNVLGGWLGDALGGWVEVVWNVLRFPLVLSLVTVGLGVIYYFAPDVKMEWRWVRFGSAFAAVMWVVISLIFSFYVSNFGSYNKTYGSLGAVMVLLLWLYLTGLVIVVGGEVNSELEHASPEGKNPGEKEKGGPIYGQADPEEIKQRLSEGGDVVIQLEPSAKSIPDEKDKPDEA